MTVVCALDARHALVEREDHGVNPFGAGNALLPPDDCGPNSAARARLAPLRERLDPSGSAAEESWKRRDVWGVLLVAYALLLRNAASSSSSSDAFASPRGATNSSPSRRSPGPVGGVRDAFSRCLVAASQLRAPRAGVRAIVAGPVVRRPLPVVQWSTIVNAVRWYAENLGQEEEEGSRSAKGGASSAASADRIRHGASVAESSTSYYYMADDDVANPSGGTEPSSSCSLAPPCDRGVVGSRALT